MAKSKDKDRDLHDAPESAEPLDTAAVPEEPAETQEAPAAPSPEETLQAALAAERDKYLRLAAEYDNFRKRTMKEREALYADVRADTILQLLPVYDNLERALQQPCTDAAYFRGMEMILEQTKDIFGKLGVSFIDAVGQPFDPALHNAVMHVEDADAGENTVVAEFQKGVRLGDKVIRFAMVQVAN